MKAKLLVLMMIFCVFGVLRADDSAAAIAQEELLANTVVQDTDSTNLCQLLNMSKAELKQLEKKAKGGSLEALESLGSLQITPEFWGYNPKKAVTTFKKGEKLGSAYSMYSLGYWYFVGIGVKQDYAMAYQYLQKAAAKEIIASYRILAVIELLGLGKNKNYTEALYWVRLALEQNDPHAMTLMGYMLMGGWGVEKDVDKAIEYYRRSADMGNPLALLELGDRYRMGQLLEKDLKEAKRLYEEAAKFKIPMINYNIGLIYLSAETPLRDELRGGELIKQAAEQRMAIAQYQLGFCYKNGFGVYQNWVQSCAWFSIAAQNNLPFNYRNSAFSWHQYLMSRMNNKEKYQVFNLEKEYQKKYLNKAVK